MKNMPDVKLNLIFRQFFSYRHFTCTDFTISQKYVIVCIQIISSRRSWKVNSSSERTLDKAISQSPRYILQSILKKTGNADLTFVSQKISQHIYCDGFCQNLSGSYHYQRKNIPNQTSLLSWIL